MNLLEKICKELGVEVGEEWLGNDGNRYKIEGDFMFRKALVIEGWAFVEEGYYWELLAGNLKPVWIPKDGDNYYIPMPYAVTDMMESLKYFKSTWDNDEDDKWLWKNNLVYETKAEAIEAANKMLAALKEDK